MCNAWAGAAGLNIAANGSILTGLPPTNWKPAGVFIQALTATMNCDASAPVMTTGSDVSQWARGESLSQPYRYRPRKIASRKKQKPSNVNISPTMPDENAMKRDQSSPNSNERAVPDTAPTTKRMPAALLQRRARVYQVTSRVRKPIPSAIQNMRGSPMPIAAKII